MIEIQHVTKEYCAGQYAPVHALRGIDLSVSAGEFLALVGPSGCGKSTLLHIMGLLDRPTAGRYYFSGRLVSALTDDELACLRNQCMGFVFQSFFLLPRLSAWRNVALPLHYRGGITEKEIKARAFDCLGRLGVAQLADHRPAEMSGGQQQRVAIARALVGDPKIILADEPTGALDSVAGAAVLNALRALNQQSGVTVVMITHDELMAAQSDRIVTMCDGRLVC